MGAVTYRAEAPSVSSLPAGGSSGRRCQRHGDGGCELLQSDQPIVITIVERPEKVQQTIPILEGMMNSGLIAITDVEVTSVCNGAQTTLP